ncbi:MAG: PepSY domain-containing protein [Roseburia sp.]|nr:PepSY domain-containing protein [Roseburia sp.]
MKNSNSFANPKKAAIFALSLVLAIALFGVGIFFGATVFAKTGTRQTPNRYQSDQNSPLDSGTALKSDGQNTPNIPMDNGNQIGLDAAKDISLADADLSPSEITYTKAELDYEDGVPVYEIKFYTSDCKYEYEINASTGAIRSQDKEWPENENIFGSSKNAGSDIGVDKAKSIAAEHAGFSVSDVIFSKAKLEKDHGNMTYEIEFYKGGMEYEYEINAQTGEILEFDSEWDD